MTATTTTNTGKARGTDRGVALLIVLWSMGLLGLLGTRITALGHADAVTAAALADHAILEAAADGAVYDAIERVETGAWPPGPPTHPGPVTVRVENEAGRINVNMAPTGLLDALLLALGLPADRAQSLAAAISDWRTPTPLAQPFGAKAAAYRAAGLDYGPPDAPFRNVGELALVLGMTPDILAALEPHITLYTEGNIDPSLADDVVKTALIRYGGNVLPPILTLADASLILQITAAAASPDGARFTRRATVRLSEVASQDDPLVTVLAWQ